MQRSTNNLLTAIGNFKLFNALNARTHNIRNSTSETNIIPAKRAYGTQCERGDK